MNQFICRIKIKSINWTDDTGLHMHISSPPSFNLVLNTTAPWASPATAVPVPSGSHTSSIDARNFLLQQCKTY